MSEAVLEIAKMRCASQARLHVNKPGSAGHGTLPFDGHHLQYDGKHLPTIVCERCMSWATLSVPPHDGAPTREPRV